MAIANLHETLLNYKLRRNALNLEISQLQSQKVLATYSQADRTSIKAQDEEAVRDYFRTLYNGDSELQELYKDYTQIPDFEAEIDKITAQYQDEMAELTAWETAIDAQVTTNSAELQEVNAYIESLGSMLKTNISDDFNYGLK